MIQLLSTAIHNIGLSSITFNIDGKRYKYETDTYHVNKCERMSRFSILKALNYIKKHSESVIKFEKKKDER